MANGAPSSTDILNSAALGPRRVSGDAGAAEQYSLTELIAYDRYAKSLIAANTRRRGLRYTRTVPDGATARMMQVGQYQYWGWWPGPYGGAVPMWVP